MGVVSTDRNTSAILFEAQNKVRGMQKGVGFPHSES